jgi:hypothetical protein
MNGNAIGAKTLGVDGRFHHVRIIPAAAVAKSGELVDIYRKPGHAAKLGHPHGFRN